MTDPSRRYPPGKVKGFLTCALLILLLQGCASLKGDQGPRAQIQIASGSGAGIEVRPSTLKIEPGETVAWNNLTTYELQIQIEPDAPKLDHSSFISPFTTVEKTFDEAGTYSYTLFYSTDRTFGRATGTIVVGNPPPERPKRERPQPEPPPRQRTPEMDPSII